MLTLAQQAPIGDGNPGSLFPQVALWLGVMAVAAVIGSVVFMFLARRLRSEPEDEPDGFTLEGLRVLHRRGDLTDEEFERARAKIIEAAQRRPPARGRVAGKAGPK